MIFKNSTLLIFLCLTTTSSSFFLGTNTGCSTSTATINSNNMNNSRRKTTITHDDTAIAATSTSSSSSSCSSSLRMSSTSATTKDLISPDDIYDNAGYEDDIAKMFDDNVFKTYGRYPLSFVSGSGTTLTSTTGRTYLDFVSGISTCILGHGDVGLAKAVSTQISQLHHVSNLYLIPQQGKLASWLVANSVADKVFFCNSGAEANEAAIKLARRHASDNDITHPVIICAEQGFHGRTLAALSATGQPKYHRGFGYGGEMVRGFEHVPYNDMDALKNMVEEINVTPKDIKDEGGKRGVAAIFLEPLQGEGGVIPGSAAYFKLARELCDSNNAFLMCDEVQVGMGRSGSLWGHEKLDVKPDVFTSAKALGGGVPIGACMARGEAANVLGPGEHGSTYGGNPLACAAGLEVASRLSAPGFLEGVSRLGERLKSGLESIANDYPGVIGEVRGWGLLLGAEVKDGCGTIAGDLVGDAMEAGLLLVTAGANTVRFVPPLIVKEEELDEALAIFRDVVATRAKSLQ